MEQKRISCGDQLPTLSVKYPWLVAQNLEGKEDDSKDQIFYNMNDPMSHYRCQIPELLGRRIQGYFHGWVILSNHPYNIMWSLWNPMTSKMIRLPPLTLKDGGFESIKQCCVSSPPNNPTSVLMLTTTKTQTIVFCHLGRKTKMLRWKEMSYAKQLRSITGGDDDFLKCFTCCKDKVYALTSGFSVIQVDIVVMDKEVVISLFKFGKVPSPFNNGYSPIRIFLKGYCKDLFYIKVDFNEATKKTLSAVYLFKLDMTSMTWEEREDLKDAVFFLDLDHECSVFYRDAIASELGGYIHIHGQNGIIIYSYDVKDKTISLSSMSCLEQSTHLSLWECRLQSDHEDGTGFKQEDEIIVRNDVVDIFNNTRNEEPSLVNIPTDVFRMILEFCVGVEYLNLRATCKHCRSAAPAIRWSSKTALRRLQKYSLVSSPWLVVFNKHRGVITFTDPMFGDKYYIRTPQKLIGDLRICCSRYGWLLLEKLNERGDLFFYNPFTNDIRELPVTPYLDSLCFIEPPTSPKCMVFGLSASLAAHVFVYSVTWKSSSWTWFCLDSNGTAAPLSFLFSTIYRQYIFALNQGTLNVFLANEETNCFQKVVVANAPGRESSHAQYYFLVSCDQHLLLVVMDELGEFVEVLKLNDPTKEWEKLDSLGSHMIYICGNTCVCMEAKTPEMENKIYFPRLHSRSGKIVFYSLETRMCHTFNGRIIGQCLQNFIGTKCNVYPHAWIDPSWS